MKHYKRALVVLSGGQDSTTCLFIAMREAYEVMAVTFDYGQRHARELQAAEKVYQAASGYAGAYECALLSHERVEVGSVLQGTSPLVNRKHNVEQYASADVLPGGIEKTFVPMRNALFLVLAYNRAAVYGCDAVFIGVSEADYGGYPDCRAPFLSRVEAMAHAALGESVADVPVLDAPLISEDKKSTVEIALGLPGCMDALAWSHTCYVGAFPPCGTCHACLLRERGFRDAGVPDPLALRAFRTGSGS